MRVEEDVIPVQVGMKGHMYQWCVPPWTPDQVRGDDVVLSNTSSR